MKNNIIYIFSIFFGVLSKIGIVVFGVLTFLRILNADLKPDFLNCLHYAVYIVFAFLCFALDKILFNIRTDTRNKIEFDEFGNKKGNAYKNLSAKEKAEIDRQRLLEQECNLSAAELKRVTHKGSKNPEADIKKLIGLQNVKEEIKKMESTMEYMKKYGKKNQQITSSHMCFLGSPGTGKTTVARIMTGILYNNKYIRKNQCIEVDSSFLKGSTPDNTLKKTKMILQQSKGGVLFIDEAYSLLDGVNSKELIAELVKFMEDNKNDFVLILAGYQNEMKELIDSNPGLYSRINKYLWFKDYDINELKEIFRLTANDCGYFVTAEAFDQFEIKISKEKKGKNFGNARTVKNIFQKAQEKHAYNIMNGIMDQYKAYIIDADDIEINTQENAIFN